ncbi:MAG: M1 family metallopeptidase [Bacteroidota bacterium]
MMHDSKYRKIIPGLLLVTVLMSSCASDNKTRPTPMQRDPHSFAHHDEVVVKHLDLQLSVDFERKVLDGEATLTIENLTGADTLFLDTRDLTIHGVALDGTTGTTFTLGEAQPHLGRPLVITIRQETKNVTIKYTTSPDAAAVQWLSPAQTAGGKLPFLFTQSQAILARTWVPCQDNPAVRMTYNARITVPSGMLALMSAENSPEKHPDGIYTFNMPHPIPSYLLALAVGDIAFKATSDRAGVYAEPSVVEHAAWEFADTEKMIQAAEKLYGPYRWGRFDILVLPPSFPFGGMENPRLTFATPTILAGDRSLVAVVAHELAHSWSGNLVTNASWGDFWLNEGFTVYFENRIMAAVYGKDYADMQALLGYQDLLNTLDDFGRDSADTKLHLDLSGRDPDDGVNDIAYEKGNLFLRTIEEAVGRERWDAFLRSYFEANAFKSMTTERFIKNLREQLIKGDRELEQKIGIDVWVYMTGLPENCPKVQSDAFVWVESQVEAWKNGTSPVALQTDKWTTQEWQHFLRKLPRPMTTAQMAELDKAFKFTSSGNSEVLHEWFLQTIANKYTLAYPALEKFLLSMGRRKFLKPLYTDLAKTPDGLAMAKRIYAKARAGYHTVSVRTIDDILKWEGS